MADPAPRRNRALLWKIGAAALLVLVAAVLLARGLDLRGLMERGLALIRNAGPVVYFAAMAILPAFGAPILAFSLTAGPAFGEKLGMPAVIGLCMLALLVNMALSYFLASRALRPLLAKLLTKLGYQLPQVAAGDATDLVVLLRVTPGLPFPVQNYLLGLSGVPFRRYLLISCLIMWPMTAALILFSDALLHGKGQVALIAVGLVLAIGTATHLLRKHYGKKKAQ